MLSICLLDSQCRCEGALTPQRVRDHQENTSRLQGPDRRPQEQGQPREGRHQELHPLPSTSRRRGKKLMTSTNYFSSLKLNLSKLKGPISVW